MSISSRYRPRMHAIFALLLAIGCRSSPVVAPHVVVAEPARVEKIPPLVRADESALSTPQHALFNQPLQPDAKLAPAERVAFERVAPVFARHCTRCHAGGTRSSSHSAMRAADMRGYPFAGAPPREMARKIRLSVGLGSKEATMPPSRGSVRLPPEDLELIAEWEASLGAANEP